jgi:uncharacterized protein (TIGR03118 family)
MFSVRPLATVAMASALALATPVPAGAIVKHPDPARTSRYSQVNLVSDVPGLASLTDPDLVNAWGLSQGPTTPLWVSDNGTDLSTLYDLRVAGTKVQRLIVSIEGGAPTGTVFNSTGSPTAFTVSASGTTGPARFIFAGENGDITAWNGAGTTAVHVAGHAGAIYKGLALVADPTSPRLLAANFHDNRIDVFDAAFMPVPAHHAFRSIGIPHGYAPFNVVVLKGKVYVSYAKQDAARHDDVAGAGHGFINVYNTHGRFLEHLVRRGVLDSPWGMAIAPMGFGSLGGKLLVGNFGNGHIHAFDPRTGRLVSTLRGSNGKPITIDGLWGLLPGNGASAASTDVWFSAGPDGEAHGLLGLLKLAP